MPRKREESASAVGAAPQRLVNATLSALTDDGAAGISARTIAGAADLPVSSIYYHFVDLEQLLESTQAEARAAAERWCDAQLGAIRDGADGPEALGPLLAALVDDWCETQRPLAFARRECQLMALRDPRYIASSAKWHSLWDGVWREICHRLGIADMATPTAWVFDGMSALHLMRWRRPVDRAALGELCEGWGRWLGGQLAGPSPWFTRARQDAAALVPPEPPADPVADAIATAAGETVARSGIAALTHRAVAAAAGVTLGVVSYKFRTSTDLLHAAFEAIYRRLAPRKMGQPAPAADLSRDDAIDRLDRGVPSRLDLLALEELIAASTRDPAFQVFAAQTRYLRGRSSGPYFQALVGADRPITAIDGAIFSALMAGRSRAYACGGRPRVTPSEDFTGLLERLDRSA